MRTRDVERGLRNEQKFQDAVFIGAFKNTAAKVNANAVNKGFWKDGAQRNRAEMIALIHSELSEALEADRHGNDRDEHCPQFSSVSVELADAIIRIMDMSAGLGLRVEEAIIAKMKFNTTRPIKHGKNF